MKNFRVKMKHLISLCSFNGSTDYWKKRYQQGFNSGSGSYNCLAEFKAKVINQFLSLNSITSVIEFGCGDGNQLSLIQYPQYLGLDVSDVAVKLCRAKFANDLSKQFSLMSDYQHQTADLTVSLDVIYHLVEDLVFENYMQMLFSAASAWVIIYSSNTDKNSIFQAKHVRHRCFIDWVNVNQKKWTLVEKIDNPYPKKIGNPDTSFADFYIFRRSV